MVPKRLSRSERQTQTRESLITAATALFARRGYDATSVDEIAEKAGVTHGAVYSNFGGKEELLRAVLERAGPTLHWTGFADAATPYPQRLRGYAQYLTREWKTIRETVLLAAELEIQATRNPKLKAGLAAYLNAVANRDGPAFDAAAQAEGIEAAIDGRTFSLLSMATIHGLLRLRTVVPELIDEQTLGDSLLMIAGFRPKDYPTPT